MRIASINLPIADNDGNPLAAESDMLRNAILEAFGGFTESSAIGAWRDPESGIVYREPVNVWHVAMDDSATNRAKLESIAASIAQAARQVCVFVTHADGTVAFVEPARVAA
jgi:Protein of unknown function (DUF3574)